MSNRNKARRSSSPAQAEASRLNGAKSLGPTTDAGKLKVHHTRMAHGFRSAQVCIHTEDQLAYTEHLNAYLARYAPIDKVEADAVSLLALHMWQVMRINAVEVALFDFEVSGIESFYEGQFETMDQYGRLALAFKKTAGDRAPELVLRYKISAERAYHRSLHAVEKLQKNRPQREISEAPGEPLPEPPQPTLHIVPKPSFPPSNTLETPENPLLPAPQDKKSPPCPPSSNP